MAKKETTKEPKLSGRYVEGVGRRKTAVARVRIVKGGGKFVINERELGAYFGTPRLRDAALAPISVLKLGKDFDISARVKGGGIKAQAEAVRHGLARALVKFNDGLKKQLRGFGFLTRDSRMVERKKYGLKKARRAPQWQKR